MLVGTELDNLPFYFWQNAILILEFEARKQQNSLDDVVTEAVSYKACKVYIWIKEQVVKEFYSFLLAELVTLKALLNKSTAFLISAA